MKVKINDQYYLRSVLKKDRDDVQSLIFRILKEYRLQPEPEGVDNDLLHLPESYENGYFGVIIDPKHNIVGTCGLYKISNEKAEIRKMYLSKEHRGIGLGKWMVGFLIKKAKSLDYSELELETASQLIEAIALYKRFGFEELVQTNQTPRCDKSFRLKLNS